MEEPKRAEVETDCERVLCVCCSVCYPICMLLTCWGRHPVQREPEHLCPLSSPASPERADLVLVVVTGFEGSVGQREKINVNYSVTSIRGNVENEGINVAKVNTEFLVF